MGEKNSSLTRVQPVFNELLNQWPSGERWVQRLCEMAAQTRSNVQLPTSIGPLLEAEAPRDQSARMGKVFERIARSHCIPQVAGRESRSTALQRRNFVRQQGSPSARVAEDTSSRLR